MIERDAIKYLQDIDKSLTGDGVHSAICVAIEALEKQIPKKADIASSYYKCPTCGATHEIGFANYKYCPKCGQRIDWGDER